MNCSVPAVSRISSMHWWPSTSTCFRYESSIVGSYRSTKTDCTNWTVWSRCNKGRGGRGQRLECFLSFSLCSIPLHTVGLQGPLLEYDWFVRGARLNCPWRSFAQGQCPQCRLSTTSHNSDGVEVEEWEERTWTDSSWQPWEHSPSRRPR